MIPQRNISLLANRLAKEGGRRIPENVLERDYCLAWFLAALAESDLKATARIQGRNGAEAMLFRRLSLFGGSRLYSHRDRGAR